MTGRDVTPFYFAEEPETAHEVWESIMPYAGNRPGDPRARVVAPDDESGVELTQPLAEALSKVAYLMSRGHAVVIQAVDDSMSIDEVAELVMQRPVDVREAIGHGLVVPDVDDPDRITTRDALLYRNHVLAERRLLLDEIYHLGDDIEDRPRGDSIG